MDAAEGTGRGVLVVDGTGFGVRAAVADGRAAFIDALRRVPGEQRRALVLYYVCDLSVAQIAAETGVPVGTVKARLARGAPRSRRTCVSRSGRSQAGEPRAVERGRVMSELGDELKRLADEGAEHARPRPPSEVIRRGDRRRHRRIVRGAVATVAAAGAITAGVVVGVAGGGRPAPAQPAARPVPATRQATPQTPRPSVSTPQPEPPATLPSGLRTPTPSSSPAVPVPSRTR